MMGAREKRWDLSDSSDDESMRRGALGPSWIPPPRATASVRTRSVLVVDDGANGFSDERAVPVAVMPPMPPMPESPGLGPASRSPVAVDEPVGMLGRSKSRRKTIRKMVEGWWDLGLLEAQKRQTMLAAGRRV
jgi:hypothetical protein